MLGLRKEDLAWDGDMVAAHLGRGVRGESSKSGRDQGVVFEDPYAVAVLRRRVAKLKDGGKVFPISGNTLRDWWRRAAKALKLDLGPPHSMRHTGASRDLATGYRSFEQVQRRGRWKSMESVQRYARPHMWAAALADLPAEIRERGESILSQRQPRPSKCKLG